MNQPDRTVVRRLAQESLNRGDPLGWFNQLYQAANGNPAAVPVPLSNPLLSS